MDTINSRIAAVVEHSGLSKSAFAEPINVSQQYVSKLVVDGNPSNRTLADICREFGVSPEWLRFGTGEMFTAQSREASDDSIGARIKQIRLAANMTQAQFAEAIGLSRNYIAMIEIGQRAPSNRTLNDICREFGASTEWLRLGTGETPTAQSSEEPRGSIGARIKILRRSLGLNQTEFGARLGYRQTTVAGWENGGRAPNDAVVVSICREFGVSSDWLRFGTGETPPVGDCEDEAFAAAQKDRIAEIVDRECNGNKSDFARRVNIAPAYAAQICAGSRSPSARLIADICREFDVSPEWLQSGAGEMSPVPSCEDSDSSIGARIKALRKSLGMSQAAFGLSLGANRNIINNAENGRAAISGMMIASICREFDVSPEWLQFGTGEMPPVPNCESSDGSMGLRLKILRKCLGLTQAEFGAKIGVKGNTITNYESGLRTPSGPVIMSICREFGVSAEWLEAGRGDMYQPGFADDSLEPFFAAVRADSVDSFRRRLIAFLAELSPAAWSALEALTNNRGVGTGTAPD